MRVVILLFLLLAGSCIKQLVASTPDFNASTSNFLSLGDSYTIGEGVAATDRWSVQLAGLVPAGHLAPPDILARTGWTTGELQHALQAAGIRKTYALVSLLIGVNNQYRGLSVAAYRQQLRELLHTAVQLAGNRPGRVVLLSVPDWGRTPFGQSGNQAQISQEIDQFNAVAQNECRRAGVAYVDITDLTRAAPGDATQFAADGLHYSGKQMRQWALRALPVVRAALQDNAAATDQSDLK